MPLGKHLLDTLERMGCGGVLLDAGGTVVKASSRAAKLLEQEIGAPDPRLTAADWTRAAIKKLVARGENRFSIGPGQYWVVIPRYESRPLIIHSIPLAEAPESGPNTVLVLIDLADTAQPAPTPLERIFGLTKAEARLAIQFAGGRSPAEIGKQSGLSMGTVRSHLAAVFAKTQTKRQGELVALLARIAVLP